MKALRRIAVVALAVAVVGGFAVAGAGAGGQADKLFVGFVDGTCANSWRIMVRADLESEIARHKEIGKYVYQCAQGDLSKGISQIQSLTAQGVDILIVTSDWGAPLLPAIRNAHRAGVTVGVWLLPVGGTVGKDYDAFAGDDFDQLAQLTAEYYAKKLKGKGNIVGIGGAAGNLWDKTYVDLMLPKLKKLAPDIKWLGYVPGDWNPAKSARQMATLISKYPQIDGVWSIEATTVMPEIQQFLAAKRPLPTFVSLDVNGTMRDFLKLKPKNPTLQWGFLSARTWGIRNVLLQTLQARAGKKVDRSLQDIKNYMTDCVASCKKLYRADMPDAWVPTSKSSPALAKKLLQQG